MGWIPTLAVVWVIFWWLYQIFKLVYMIPELWEVKLFYANVLEIQDSELQTLLWNTVVTKIINSYKSEMEENGLQGLDMDAHVVANMIMRKENYLIALFNKEILDLRVPYLGQKQWMTRQMQAYISYGVFSYVFDLKGRVGKRFLKKAYRAQLVDGLRKRFQTMGLLSLLFSPFLFIFMIVRYFLTITEEYRQNPALLTSRSYSPLALWKFREFNELPHLFDKRLSRSYESAAKYMQQFPNYYMIILARFISFVSGSFATVLLVITLYEDEFQQGFEITPGRSAFFFVGIFGTIFAATNGYTKENLILEPQKQMNEIVLDTHYHPPAWRSKAHLPEVRDEFSNLFELKVVLLAQELFSVLLAPIILYYGLPRCSEQIIDFFSECTVVSPKLGHVCSFAKFDLQKHGNAEVIQFLN